MEKIHWHFIITKKYEIVLHYFLFHPVCTSFHRYGYFGRETPEVVSLVFFKVSGCLTEGQIFLSASGEEMVSINTRDTMGIRMLQKEEVEVGIWKGNIAVHLA